MPERFLLQILRSLVNHGLLHSTRGVDGGYHLARPPNQITLRDVVEAFDNPLDPTMPDFDGLPSAVRDRVLVTLGYVSSAARKELQKLTIADLLRSGEESGENGRSDVLMPSTCDYET